jgi:murein DD-endopeptidase MepM/ murein hydrolase activator NlpD
VRAPLLALLLLGACVAPPAAAPPASPPPPAAPAPPPVASIPIEGGAVQGGLVFGAAPEGVAALTLDGQAVPIATDRRFLLAFDRDAPARMTLRARFTDGHTLDQPLTVAPGNWRIERVDASPTAGLSSEAFKARRAGELARIAAARATGSASEGWRQRFIWPVTARLSGHFGAQRLYRGAPGSYHSGTDLAAPAGTLYVAPADGVVVLAAEAPFTLEGRLLIVDHGMGLSSAFLHSSALLVREGDRVRQGQPIGRVGQTGRATGPHLHWGLKWQDARIDPERVVEAAPRP